MRTLRSSLLDRSLGALAATGAALVLSSCGGGGGPDDATSAAEGAGRRFAMGVTKTLGGRPIPADAHIKGMFGPVAPWPLIPVHAVMLADGRVLTWGTRGGDYAQTGYFIYDVWDPTAGIDAASHLTLPNGTGTDLFCTSMVQLPSGEGVLMSGGDNWTGRTTTNRGNSSGTYFRLSDNSLSSSGSMALKRWYATSTVLLNGEVMVQGGIGDAIANSEFAEIRGLDGTYRPLTGFSTSTIGWTYPRNFVVGGGAIFGFDTAGLMYRIDPTGNGSLTSYGNFAGPKGNGSAAAMFRPGKILQFGGTSAGALVIDVTSGTPVVTPTQALSAQRYWGNATILPNGQVLASGGSRVDNELVDVVYTTEIWDPQQGTWTLGASGVQPRLYHSEALLLADGSVMVGGGGAPGPVANNNIEIYYPPYLFVEGGQLATRPAITGGPSVANIGSTVHLDVDSARPIARVTLVKTGAVTHSFNADQRFVELTFNRVGNRLNVQMPTIASDATPGQYMLFALDDAGVPSEAWRVRVNVAPVQNPALVPVLAAIANQTTTAGTAVSLGLSASDPNGDVLAFTAAALPPGLTIDASSGVISGVPTATGSYSVTVTVSDGLNAASLGFTWTVTGSASVLGVGPAPDAPPPSSVSGSAAVFSALGTGTGVEYSWNFGDGSADTEWSPSGSATHAYSQPGTYVVNVSARNSAGQSARYSFVQAVYLPAAAGTPMSSSSIVVEPRTAGAYRVWMANPDNNSVSVFDGQTRVRLAEITVGTSPRALALAANGRMWVTNKQSSTISVIDTNTLAVTNSIALGLGTRPHGIAVSADKLTAYVALEASGSVARLNTATLATTATVDVGSNPRHLSLNGTGTQLLVSRFITPLQPGESTLQVTDNLAGVKTGGEIVVLNPATMAAMKTIVLSHSAQPDSERSARGVPNYLGAAVVSPDGTQAWVPSKQDNVLRGGRRDGNALDFQTTVRAIVSRVDLTGGTEDLPSRQDVDNASLANAGVYDPTGAYLFVTLETSRELVVIDVHRRAQLFRVDTGRAPQGLVVSPDGATLWVENFMDRTAQAYDLRPLLRNGQPSLPAYDPTQAISTEKLAPAVLKGKQLFYDARDPRLARDNYMSCASCHNDGGSDGRVWDLSSQGEGLRRTISLRGKGKDGGHGFRHWSGNFDEVQDFEGQIRTLAGGTGLMSDAAFNSGTTSQPLGAAKAGISNDLDALAAYVNSLNVYDSSPFFGSQPQAVADGRAVFQAQNCIACHGGSAFSSSGDATLFDIGTIKASSGNRLGGPLTGIDPPTLRGLFAQTAFLHDGSAGSIGAAVQAHKAVSLTSGQLSSLVSYLRTIGAEEPAPPVPAGSGTGLTGSYFGNGTVSGTPIITRTEAINFSWGTAAPGSGLPADNWSARWTGLLETPLNGTYRLQFTSDDGLRVWVNGQLIINEWGSGNGNVKYVSPPINSSVGNKLPIVVEHNDLSGGSTVIMRWTTPGSPSTYVVVPTDRQYAASSNVAPTVTLNAPATATVGVATTLSASAADSDGTVVKVEFFDGDTLVATATSAPFEAVWTPTGAGLHSITARATDNTGAATTSAVASVTVSPPANVPPTVTLSAAGSGTVGVATTLSASAVDSDGTIAKVEFFDDATLLGTVTSSPYNMTWTPNIAGAHSLTARATDNAGAASTSPAVQVAVSPAAPTVGTGLLGSYFANVSLAGAPVTTRVEAVSFVWSTGNGTQVPAPGLPENNWSVRWTGSVQWPTDGVYTLQITADDGLRVRINGVTVVNSWKGDGNVKYTLDPIHATAGTRTAIEIEHYDGLGDSTVKLRWLTPTSPVYWADVPAAQLFVN